MQSYTEPRNVTTKAEFQQPFKTENHVKDVTTVLLIAALTAAAAIQLVKAFGLANGMDAHTRMMLSSVGLSVCFVAAPTFLIFGRQMSIKTGLVLGVSVVFVACVLASMIA